MCRHHASIEIALAIVVTIVSLAGVAFLLGLFVWAARRDGEADRALQKRLGIRRKTRLGR